MCSVVSGKPQPIVSAHKMSMVSTFIEFNLIVSHLLSINWPLWYQWYRSTPRFTSTRGILLHPLNSYSSSKVTFKCHLPCEDILNSQKHNEISISLVHTSISPREHLIRCIHSLIQQKSQVPALCLALRDTSVTDSWLLVCVFFSTPRYLGRAGPLLHSLAEGAHPKCLLWVFSKNG